MYVIMPTFCLMDVIFRPGKLQRPRGAYLE